MRLNISDLLRTFETSKGSTPYVSKIHENLLHRLVEMKNLPNEVLMTSESLSDNPQAAKAIEDLRNHLFNEIERNFGQSGQYEEVARQAFETADLESIDTAIQALIEQVIPDEAITPESFSRGVDIIMKRTKVSLASKMAANIRGELSKVFDDCRTNQYRSDFGSVFGLDICDEDRAEYEFNNRVVLKCAWDLGLDKDRYIEHKPDTSSFENPSP